MEELARIFSSWVLSVYGLAHVIGWAIITAAAIRCSHHRAVTHFAFIVFLVWLSASLIAISSSVRVSSSDYAPLWSLLVAIVYAIPLAAMIQHRAGPLRLALVSLLLLAIQLPLSISYSLAAHCFVGGDCP